MNISQRSPPPRASAQRRKSREERQKSSGGTQKSSGSPRCQPELRARVGAQAVAVPTVSVAVASMTAPTRPASSSSLPALRRGQLAQGLDGDGELPAGAPLVPHATDHAVNEQHRVVPGLARWGEPAGGGGRAGVQGGRVVGLAVAVTELGVDVVAAARSTPLAAGRRGRSARARTRCRAGRGRSRTSPCPEPGTGSFASPPSSLTRAAPALMSSTLEVGARAALARLHVGDRQAALAR